MVFVDDGSTDNTQEILRRFPRVKNIQQKNMGLSYARNVGMNAARGEVIVYTDSRSGRDKSRVADVLRVKEIPFTELSVDEDESTRSWVTSTARTSDLPVVFIAGKPVGGYDAIIQLDVKGELEKLVWN